jgi:hypothetical protein
MLLSTLVLAATASAAVVVIPGGGDPKPYSGLAGISSEDAYFRESAPNAFFNNSAKLIMSSLSATNMSSAPGLHPSGDSFIRGAIQAWGEHLHLVIRPDEVWFTILVQMNFYMLSHAEEIRDLFVDHQGQETILIKDFTWHAILLRFQDEIQARVKTPWLRDWITPNFTTTTPSDLMTANILMMGLTKAYFKYTGKLVCGLPSVTLLGTQEDWAALLSKLNHLPAFGPEPAEYAARLRPILTRFVSTFTYPDATNIRQFWNQIVSAQATHICGEPPVYISGWIAGFYYWNDNGRPYARPAGNNTRRGTGLTLDDIEYPFLDMETAPVGYARAPFEMLDYGGVDKFPAYVAAGTLGKQITVGPPEGYEEAVRRTGGGDGGLAAAADASLHGMLQPLSGWMLYGPVDHDLNVTASQWQMEEELFEVLGSARRFMTGETCGLVEAPKSVGG